MRDSALLRIVRRRLQAIRETLAAWPPGANGVKLSHDLEDLVRECLNLPVTMKDIWHTMFDRFAAGQYDRPEDIMDFRDPLESLFDEALATAEAVRARAGGGNGLG